MSDTVALRPGTILADDYRIERTIGAGGFGITYLAEEISLARLVTIKEFFPVDFAARDHIEDVVPRSHDSEADYTWGLDRFLAEAQTLARFDHPNIVRVYRYFLARNTGYIVLHYEEGQSLKGWLRSLGRAPRQHELDQLIEPLLGALETIHEADFLHRDIAPDNIMIRREGQPVLIDFGSARGDIARHSKTISALVKSGYSPYEQYATTSRQQGPWTDIYSLGATLYEAVTGKRPPDAPSRMVADELIPPGDAALSSYRPGFLAAVAKSLRLEITERPRSVAKWRADLMAPAGGARNNDQPAIQPEPVAASPLGGSATPPATPPPTPVSAAPPSPATSSGSGLVAALDAMPQPAGGGGLAAAFLDGWRKANPAGATPPAPVAEAAEPAVAETPAVAKAPAAKQKKPGKAAAVEQPVAAAAVVVAASPAADAGSGGSAKRRLPAIFAPRQPVPAPAPEPGARKATPRAFRKRATGGWRALAAKLALGLMIAGGAVMVQNQLPIVRREGAGVLTSQAGLKVPLVVMKGHGAAVVSVRFTNDHRRIVTASMDGTLKLWGAHDGSLIRTIELDAGPATAMAINDGRAATGHKNGTIAFWNLENGSKLATFKRNEASIWALSFAGQKDRIAAAGHDWAVAVWDVGQPQAPLHLLEGHESAGKALAYSDEGTLLASGSADSTVKLWNLDGADLVRTYRGHDDFITAVAISRDGRSLASASLDGQIRLWSTKSRRLKRRMKLHKGGVPGLAFTPDNEQLVSAGNDGTVRVWDVDRGKFARILQEGAGPVTALAISQDGRRVAVAGADGSVRVWDMAAPKSGD